MSLASFDPTSLALDTLFVDPEMFHSRRAWRRAGFEVLDPAKEIECMVASHPSAPGYLFKRYKDVIPLREQRKNYKRRIEGSEALTKFIATEQLSRIVVPKKYLHALPETFSRDKKAHVLVVERLDILGESESARQYHDIDESLLRELLRVIVKFKGLDSNSKNVQFTRDGKIAFVDLENWNIPGRKETRLKSIGTYLSKEKFKLARAILKDLG